MGGSYRYTPYVLPMLTTAAFVMALAVFCLRRRTLTLLAIPILMDVPLILRSDVYHWMWLRIADLNPAALVLLSGQRSKTIGKAAAQVLSTFPDLLQVVRASRKNVIEMQRRTDMNWHDASITYIRIFPAAFNGHAGCTVICDCQPVPDPLEGKTTGYPSWSPF